MVGTIQIAVFWDATRRRIVRLIRKEPTDRCFVMLGRSVMVIAIPHLLCMGAKLRLLRKINRLASRLCVIYEQDAENNCLGHGSPTRGLQPHL